MSDITESAEANNTAQHIAGILIKHLEDLDYWLADRRKPFSHREMMIRGEIGLVAGPLIIIHAAIKLGCNTFQPIMWRNPDAVETALASVVEAIIAATDKKF